MVFLLFYWHYQIFMAEPAQLLKPCLQSLLSVIFYLYQIINVFVALCKQTRDAACASWLSFISATLYTQIRWHFLQGLLRSPQAHRACHKFVLKRHNKLLLFYCQTLSGSTSNHWGAAQLVSSSALWESEAALCAFHAESEAASGLLIHIFLGWVSSWKSDVTLSNTRTWSSSGQTSLSPPGQWEFSREFLHINSNNFTWSD